MKLAGEVSLPHESRPLIPPDSYNRVSGLGAAMSPQVHPARSSKEKEKISGFSSLDSSDSDILGRAPILGHE
jgi:hypothetical protein